jgi:hypothetical protein
LNPSSGPDERLLEELRELLGRDATPPSSVVEAAKESYTWRTIDAELAELTHDSLVDQPAVRTRGAPDRRALTFEARDLVIEVEVSVAGQERRLLGQLVPAQPARIEVRQAGATRSVEADAAGRFTVSGLESRPVSLRCRLAGQDLVSTEWVLI